MGSIRARPETGKLFFDFRYQGKRCREHTALPDTTANRKKMKQILDRIEAEITLGSFDYTQYFPDSPHAAKFQSCKTGSNATNLDTPLFEEFSKTWLQEMCIQWRTSHYKTVCNTFQKYLVPKFGQMAIGQITKPEIMEFRISLAIMPGQKGKTLSPSRINHVMTPLRMILAEAADRFSFSSPYHGIKSLKVPRTDVEPFSLAEVKQIIDNVRPDFKNYYTVRFFTGMRTSEIDGLKWQFVDFDNRQILIREALVHGEVVYTKNDGSFRTIDMSQPVYDALKTQHTSTSEYDYVFCTRAGTPLEHNNVTKRVWYPLLRHLELRQRRPYQTRHTAATLWLAAGESPEWIARQMGHTTTEMLFRVYSRFVPNLTRQDGSAFERLLVQAQLTNQEIDDEQPENATDD